MLWTLPAIPVAAATAVLTLRRRPPAAVGVALGALVITLALAIWAAVVQPTTTLRWGAGLELTAAVTGFARVMVVLVPVVAVPVVAYAAATERAGRLRLLALMVGFVGAMELLVVAADLLTILIAWELIGASSWALIGHGWHDRGNGPAAAQAFVTTRVGDLGLYLAAGLTFAGTGTFDLAAIGDLDGAARSAVAAGILLAAAAKSAQLPFSPWLFAAMAGPTPVSALLHSATLVSAGAYLLVRVAPMLEPVGWFLPAVAAIGVATAVLGSLVALAQDHIKRVLAGSTSAQYGLMFLAVGAGSVAAAGAQLVTHALFKSLLFLAAGVAIHAAGSSDLDQMRLGRSLPGVAAMAGVGALALAAVPPLGGGWSKEQIVAASLERSPWLGTAALLVAVLTAAYATRFWLRAFGPGSPDTGSTARRPGRVEVTSLALLAGGTLVLGVLWLPGSAPVVERLTGGRLGHAGVTGQLLAVAAVAAGLLGTWAFDRSARLRTFGVPQRLRSFAAGWFGLPVLARVLVVDPVLASSRLLAAGDARVVDAGVRGAVRLVAAVSRLIASVGEVSLIAVTHGVGAGILRSGRFLRRRAEHVVDGIVQGVAAGTDLLGSASRRLDDRGLDATVEGIGRVTGAVGRQARATQTGLSHRYYLYVTAGTGLLILALATLR